MHAQVNGSAGLKGGIANGIRKGLETQGQAGMDATRIDLDGLVQLLACAPSLSFVADQHLRDCILIHMVEEKKRKKEEGEEEEEETEEPKTSEEEEDKVVLREKKYQGAYSKILQVTKSLYKGRIRIRTHPDPDPPGYE